MRKSCFFAAALMSVALVGCSQDDHLDFVDADKSKFTGVMEVLDSRTSLNDENKVVWNLNDQVSIFEGDNANSLYKVSSITDGKADFEFESYEAPEEWIDFDDNYAVYPYDEENSIDADGIIYAPVAAEYTFKDEASSIATALMVAKSSGYSLNFTNAQGILCLRLNAQKATKYGAIKSIKFTSQANNLSGTAKMSWDGTNPPEAEIVPNGAGKELTINLDESLLVVLPESTTGTYAEYYVPVVPTTFEANDLAMTITWTSGEEYGPIVVPSKFSVERKKIKNIKHTVGKSSFDGVIDDDITFDEITNPNQLALALKKGGTFTLAADVSLDEAVVVPEGKTVTLNLNGKDINITAAYDENNYEASSAIVNNGNLTLTGNATIKATNNYTIRNNGTMIIDGVTIENGLMNFDDLTIKSGNISNGRSGKHAIYGNNAKLTIDGGKFHNENPGNATVFAYAGEVVINDGEFSIADGTSTLGWTSCLIDAQGNAKYTLNGGIIKGEIRDYDNNTKVYGGTFTHTSVNSFVAEGYQASEVEIGKWMVLPSNATVVTPTNITSMTFDGDNVTYTFVGDFTGEVVISAAASKNQTFDGNAATFGNHIKFTANRIADNKNEITVERSGSYTFKGFKTNNSIAFGSCAVESLKIEDCEAYMMYLNITNSVVAATGNKIVRPVTAEDSYKRYDGNTQKDIIQVYAENYSLTLTGNTIKDEKGVGNNMEVYGNYEGFQASGSVTWTNSITATGNTIANVNAEISLVKMYNDVTYAPVKWPEDYVTPDETKALATQLKSQNTLSGGSCVVEILCRAASKEDKNVQLDGDE